MLEPRHRKVEKRPRVLVVSDVLLYREGVARGLEQTGHFEIVGAASGEEVMVVLSAGLVDAVVLDASEPAALQTGRALRARWDAIPIIGFGIASDAGSLACAEAGLRGFIGRDGSVRELALAIERALAGEVLCSAGLAALLCDRLARLAGMSPTVASGVLTRRECEIAELVSEGLSNKEIALALHIGPATVKNHIHAILEKLQVARRSAIAGRLRPGLRPASPLPSLDPSQDAEVRL
ncbi:MAG: response regulator transcription factor [Acetobacteraceae bacterium]|nr:response regulator transcription factor [Acetobacteraceae bacterium]